MNLESDNFNEEESDKCVTEINKDEFIQVLVDSLTEQGFREAELRLDAANDDFLDYLQNFRQRNEEVEPIGSKALKLKKIVESMYNALLTCSTSRYREEIDGQHYIQTEQMYNKALVEDAIKQYESRSDS